MYSNKCELRKEQTCPQHIFKPLLSEELRATHIITKNEQWEIMLFALAPEEPLSTVQLAKDAIRHHGLLTTVLRGGPISLNS